MKIWVPKCICLLSRFPFYKPLKKIIRIIEEIGITKSPPIMESSLTLEEILFYLTQQIPKPIPNSVMTIPLANKEIEILMRKEDDFPEIPFKTMKILDTLGLLEIIQIYKGLLLEKKLIFVSSNIPLLTKTIETFLSAIYPLKYI